MRLSLKWNGKLYDSVEVDVSAGMGIDLKNSIYKVTGVEPERQKVIIKGTILKDDIDLNELNLNEDLVLMLMGTPQDKFTPVEQGTNSLLNQQTEEQEVNAEATQKVKNIPTGLINLGNTCYFNSVLQCLYSLKPSPSSLIVEDNNSLAKAIATVFSELEMHPQRLDNSSNNACNPILAYQALISVNPLFGQLDRNALTMMQQDAEECLSFILSKIQFFKDLFTFEMRETLINENDSEDRIEKTESLHKITCVISANVNNLSNGIKEFFNTTMVTVSPKTKENASFVSKSIIAKSPECLLVQMGRFFFRQDTKKGTKILKKVSFPFKLDLKEFCTEDNANTQFSLRAIITHKGRNIDYGHYIAWCLGYDKKWIKFDDASVEYVSEDEIKSLDGGGDWHMSYLLFYERDVPE